jgi:hypothetical protein
MTHEDLINSYGDHTQRKKVSPSFSKEQTPWKPDNFWASQAIPSILRKPKVHYPALCSANTIATLHLQRDIDFIRTCYLMAGNVHHIPSLRLAQWGRQITYKEELQISLYMRNPSRVELAASHRVPPQVADRGMLITYIGGGYRGRPKPPLLPHIMGPRQIGGYAWG